ncbi:hypothetical protein VNO78_00303 [Psophocarpus tetragonolobus]|uniref:Uncharacterized protein n=1 Tax=Psophocarpus tetragonolobus TaxID=3891 RepID=A0AAN9SX83_PSOTE
MRRKKKKEGGSMISNNKGCENKAYAGVLKKGPPLSRFSSVSVYAQQQPPLLPLPQGPKKPKATKGDESIVIAPSWGPDPKDLPIVVLGMGKGNIHSLFNLAPPPSSLPLPNFSLRSKLACNAAAVDHGATNNLRRLLRL